MRTKLEYDAKSYWDEKARHAGANFESAVCYDDPLSNQIIDRVQRRFMRRALAQIVQRTSLRGKRVLDYGCGTGRWVDFFRGYGLRYSGVDLSSEMVRLASARFLGTSFQSLAGSDIPFAPLTFDLVCSIAVIHHNPYPQQQSILLQLNRVLKPGGFLVLFESVGALRSEDALEFPRPREDWNASLTELGMKPLWCRQTRYFSTQAILDKLVGQKRFNGVSGKLGLLLDPYLGSVVPPRYRTRVAMVFQKRSR